MAHVHFGIRKLAIETDQPVEGLIAKLQDRLSVA
jgi:hypothetical protein